MKSYFDEISGDRVASFSARSFELSNALSEISAAAGDQSDTAGRPDYLVRFVVGTEVGSVPCDNAFVVHAEGSGVVVLEGIGGNEPTEVSKFSWRDPWFDDIQESFREFRDKLDM